MKSKTITIVMQNRGRGSGVVVKNQITAFIDSGYKVNVVCPHEFTCANKNFRWIKVDLRGKRIPVHEYLPGVDGVQAASQLTNRQSEEYIQDYQRALEPVLKDSDFVLGHHMDISSIAMAEKCVQAGVKHGMYIHGTCIEGFLNARKKGVCDAELWNRLIKATEQTVINYTISKYVLERLFAPIVTPTTLNRTKVIWNQTDISLQQQVDSRELTKYYLNKTLIKNQPFVLFVGAMIKSKGVNILTEASKYYGHLAKTIFIGQGELENFVEAKGSGCISLGFVNDSEKASLMSEAYILAEAREKEEHFGLTLTEALSLGTPALSFARGAAPELIQHNVTGYLVDEFTPRAYGLAIAYLLQHPETVDSIRGASLMRYAQLNFGPTNTMQKFISSIDNIIEHNQ